MWAQLISMRLKAGGEAGLSEVLAAVRAAMADVIEGPAEFVDLTVVGEATP